MYVYQNTTIYKKSYFFYIIKKLKYQNIKNYRYSYPGYQKCTFEGTVCRLQRYSTASVLLITCTCTCVNVLIQLSLPADYDDQNDV